MYYIIKEKKTVPCYNFKLSTSLETSIVDSKNGSACSILWRNRLYLLEVIAVLVYAVLSLL